MSWLGVGLTGAMVSPGAQDGPVLILGGTVPRAPRPPVPLSSTFPAGNEQRMAKPCTAHKGTAVTAGGN